MGLVVAGGLLLGTAGESSAQFSLTIGNPYIGQGYGSNLGGYGGYSSAYGSNVLGYSNYSSSSSTGYLSGPGVIGARNYGYGGYASPGYAYSSGYSGFVPPAAPIYNTGATYIANPLTGYQTNRYYGAYGYGNYGYGSRDGFRPFRPIGRLLR